MYVNGVFYLYVGHCGHSTTLCHLFLRCADSGCSCLQVATLELCLVDTASGHLCMFVACVSVVGLFNM